MVDSPASWEARQRRSPGGLDGLAGESLRHPAGHDREQRRRADAEPLELRDGALELEDAVYRAFVLGADRGDRSVGADERVDGQEPEVRGCVDHDLVVAVEDGLERVVEEALAAELADEAHLDAECAVAEPELSGERALGVGVDHERVLPLVGEEHSDVRCGRGLPDAALLVCDRCRGGHDALLRPVGW